MKKKILIIIAFFILLISVSVIVIYWKNHPVFTEEVIFSDEFNPELETYKYIYFDYKGDISVHEGEQECVYVDNDRKLYFSYPGDFDSWYFGEELNSGETKYRKTFSMVSGIEKEEFEGVFYSPQPIFPLENENIAIVFRYINEVKVVVINPNENKMVDVYEFPTPSQMVMLIDVKFVTEENTILYDPNAVELLLYDNNTEELVKKLDIPGQSFYSGNVGIMNIEEYDQYWYTANKTGIYRMKPDKLEWECVVPALKAKSISGSNLNKDMLVVSDSEIYLLITKDHNEDGSKATAELVKFNIEE